MSEKTEQPTPKRLRDARKKGQLLFSREVVSIICLVGVGGCLLAIFSFLGKKLITALNIGLTATHTSFQEDLSAVIDSTATFLFFGSGAVVATAFLTGILGNLIQIGFYFSASKLTKGLQSVNFINNAKNIFSKKNFYSLLLNLAKVSIITLCAWQLLKHHIPIYIGSLHCGIDCMSLAGARGLITLMVTIALIFVVVAALDYLMQRHFYLSELKMSIDEIKREFKESEGSPEIKSFRKQAHKEAVESQMLNGVEDSSAVIRNPTHYAIAFHYDGERTPLPFITAKGQGALAEAIIRRAEQHDVPVITEPALAQGLYAEADLNDFIPKEFFTPVAQVLRYVAEQSGTS